MKKDDDMEEDTEGFDVEAMLNIARIVDKKDITTAIDALKRIRCFDGSHFAIILKL